LALNHVSNDVITGILFAEPASDKQLVLRAWLAEPCDNVWVQSEITLETTMHLYLFFAVHVVVFVAIHAPEVIDD
jgi:hypothetical protein